MRKIALIACGKTKAAQPSAARRLYLGDLFQKSLRYAEEVARADAIFVLSAKYGLVALDQKIEPYEMTLNGRGAREKREWAERVLAQLRDVADLERDVFVMLAGENYRKHLEPSLRHVEVPMDGLMFGQQLQFLKRALQRV